MRKILIICVDGLGLEYLEMAPTPNIDRIAKEGSFVIGQGVIPSVTNVNNVSIITGAPPRIHGITSNYWVDRTTGEGCYMESPDFLCRSTVLQRAKSVGMSTALLTSKKKLQGLLDAGADYSLSAEEPDEGTIHKIGPKQDIYSSEINLWLFKALKLTLKERNPDVVYCSTTDWTMHKYAPHEDESFRHIQGIDSLLGQILDENPDREVYLTADHGMSAKSRGIDVRRLLRSEGIEAQVIPIIKDRYEAHHQNLGGAVYVYLGKPELIQETLDVLQGFSGIEAVYPREEAAEKFELMADRIGDLFVLGDKDVVFGNFEAIEVPVKVRTHGSRHESVVPIITYGSKMKGDYQRNLDLVARLEI
ncbi:MAG TPA: PglZ domain-containing protein [Candidatus Latescibacteria bacterium]|nr:PglZ domain-containing protein [Candidatus Latescibacterota bacterium]